MGNSLQSYDESNYERPNQPWDCGHACEGLRCPQGPTSRGSCQADFECAPLEKNGKWICSRSSRHGGKCEDGPLGSLCSRGISKCSPVASIRRRRGAFVLWCCTATLGLTLLTLGASWRDQVIRPGELSNQHAQIIKKSGTGNRCAACHSATENSGLDGWTQMALMGGSEHATQAQRCLACHHDKIGEAETAMFPHGLPKEQLAGRTRSICERLGQSPRETSLVGVHDGRVACAACHREHQGSVFDLTAMSNGQCAECHQQNFRSLSGHPEFGAWPYKRRTRIAFDHAMHQGRYFPEQKQTFACQTCHSTVQQGDMVGIVSYESCKACHDQKIEQSLSEGVPLVVLPMLDLKAFHAEGFSVGEWPELANGDFDGPLPPLTRVLLSTDQVVRASMEQFGNHFEFADVDPDNIDDLEAAANIAWGLKRLIHDLNTGGPAVMKQRLEAALDQTMTDEQLRDALGQLPREAAVGLQQAWFPNLAREVADREAGKTLPVVDQGIGMRASADSQKARSEIYGWHRDDETFRFSFRPRGHASKFLTIWLTMVSSSPKVQGSEAVIAAFKQLTSQTTSGLCATCHSVDANPSGDFNVQWFAKSSEARSLSSSPGAPKSFTRFSHGPHLILPQLRDCTACHKVNTEITTAGDYLQNDPSVYQSGFHPISKQDCASCHAPKMAGDSCTMCHQYHVGSGVSTPMEPSLEFRN